MPKSNTIAVTAASGHLGSAIVHATVDIVGKDNVVGLARTCHPGSSATSLISTSGGIATNITWWLMTKSPLVQTAEKGAYPEVMEPTAVSLPQRIT
jgi:hypothetical protein